jgi:hypothetical protein
MPGESVVKAVTPIVTVSRACFAGIEPFRLRRKPNAGPIAIAKGIGMAKKHDRVPAGLWEARILPVPTCPRAFSLSHVPRRFDELAELSNGDFSPCHPEGFRNFDRLQHVGFVAIRPNWLKDLDLSGRDPDKFHSIDGIPPIVPGRGNGVDGVKPEQSAQDSKGNCFDACARSGIRE